MTEAVAVAVALVGTESRLLGARASLRRRGRLRRSESSPFPSLNITNARNHTHSTSMMTIGGVGLALGAVFLYILARPEKAATQSGFGGPNPTGGGRPGNSNEGSGAGSRTPGQRAS